MNPMALASMIENHFDQKKNPKLGIINGSIRYINNIFPHRFQMDIKKRYNASPHKCLVNFNDFLEKNIKL